ncbi:MAG TPA: phosphotransferase [Ktedonobacterales bacterium]|jgi:Ser/Thr protein kinase RdoA (MazF antagonist)|nr:phosphotransferase [Ktedonobacterales bacterium]
MSDTSARRPTERDAALAVRASLAVQARTIQRFNTGNCHYVYDVLTEDGRRVVARLANDETRDVLAGGVYWHQRLRGVGAPIPALLASDLTSARDFPYMLLERLPGDDLGAVYDTLTRAERHTLAAEIVALQRSVARLPRASGFGFARSYDDPTLRSSWLDVVTADLERSRQRIAAAGVVSPRHIERVGERIMTIGDYLRAIEPTPFLDDTTTKNVIVWQGRLSGVVDTDVVCFGDPLFTLALTRVALLAHRLDVDYADHWQALLTLDGVRERALTVYVALFLVGFMSELGQRFNRAQPEPIDETYLRHLERLLDEALAAG